MSDELIEPYQDENASFDGGGEIPTQTEAQQAKAFDVAEYMRDVIDPELGINVVDLGLVYDIWFTEEPKAGADSADDAADATKEIVNINMTLTSPACPLTDVIGEQIDDAVVGNKLADEVRINWVWMPPWGPNLSLIHI